MRDDEIADRLERVDAIVEELEQGEATLEEGEQLKQEAIQLLEEVENLIAGGAGTVAVVEERGGEVVEKPFEPASRQ